MNRRLFNLTILTLALAVSAGDGLSRQQRTTPTPTQSQAPTTPQSFVQKTAEGNQAEIEMAKMAVNRAQARDVKNFAQMLVDDHTKVLNTFKQYAQKKAITLRLDPPAKSSNTIGGLRPEDPQMKELSAKTGKDFDRAFVKTMLEKHEKGVATFEEQERAKLGDAELQTIIRETLPTLRNHLARVKELDGTLAATPAPVPSRK